MIAFSREFYDRIVGGSPALRLLVPLVAGIALAETDVIGLGARWWVAMVACLLVATMILFLKGKKTITSAICSRGFGIAAFGALVCVGMLSDFIYRIAHTTEWPAGECCWQGVVAEPPRVTAKTCRFTMIVAGNGRESKVMTTVLKKALPSMPEVGDVLRFHAEITKPHNDFPNGDFDYALWLRRRGVEGMAFVARKAETVSEPRADAFRSGLSFLAGLKIKALCVRHELLEHFDTFERDTTRRSVLAAISLGDKSMLDKSLKSQFADVGVSHVLALSGLHLGIIMMFLLFMFRPLRMFDFARWAVPLASVVFLWLFVLLTGCGVSVVRSAFMLSCVLLLGMRGDVFSSFGNVVLAALVILLFSPPSLFDISFLLSFLTVGMLVFLMPYYRESHWRLSWGRFAFVADFVYVSLVAWVMSAPLVACVFGRVPLYFFLGNVVAIPCAWLILVVTMCFLLLSWLPGVAELLGMLIDGSLAVLLGATDFIAGLPAASVEVSLGLGGCLALYMVIVSVVCFVLSHTRVHLYLLLLSTGLFLSFLLWGV